MTNSKAKNPVSTATTTPATHEVAASSRASPGPASPALDVAAEIARIGLEDEDSARLEDLADCAIAAMEPERIARVARLTERLIEGRGGRPGVMARARTAAGYLLALHEHGTSTRAARALGWDLKDHWSDVMAGMDAYPVLRAVNDWLTRGAHERMAATARHTVECGLDGEDITRAQERLAPMVLERLDRKAWAPDRGGSASGADKTGKSSPASVIINIQSGEAFGKCCDVLRDSTSQTIDA